LCQIVHERDFSVRVGLRGQEQRRFYLKVMLVSAHLTGRRTNVPNEGMDCALSVREQRYVFDY
jgi:hypothetical protein